MATLGVVYNIASPSLYHARQDVWKLRASDARLGEYLGVVTAYVLNNLEWLTRAHVYEAVLRLAGYGLTLIENDVGGMGYGAWLYSL